MAGAPFSYKVQSCGFFYYTFIFSLIMYVRVCACPISPFSIGDLHLRMSSIFISAFKYGLQAVMKLGWGHCDTKVCVSKGDGAASHPTTDKWITHITL